MSSSMKAKTKAKAKLTVKGAKAKAKVCEPIKKFLYEVMRYGDMDFDFSGWELVPGITALILEEVASISLSNGEYRSEPGFPSELILVGDFQNKTDQLSQETLDFIKLYVTTNPDGVFPFATVKFAMRIPLKALASPEGDPSKYYHPNRVWDD